MGIRPAHAPATVIGFDIVRGADGRLKVLEDNLRTPSGLAYAAAARYACDAWLDDPVGSRRRALEPAFATLGEALRAAAPEGRDEPNVILLTDGPSNSAWFEHREIAGRLGIPVVTPDRLRCHAGRLYLADEPGLTGEVHVVYRRTDEDRLLDERRRPTWISDLLLRPIHAGTVSVVNSFGAGVADDKLAHAYVEAMIRFYLGEEPLIESVPTLDLGHADTRESAGERLDELVVKPRSAYGGAGVVIGSELDATGYRKIKRLIAKSRDGFVAQEIIALSRHPTAVSRRSPEATGSWSFGLEPRHVDLRVFAVTAEGRTSVLPAPLTRVALERGSLVVNSTRGGGGKDTWVLG
jgi:uncharacterized circularly permuted ATP-grasp superfamily protein